MTSPATYRCTACGREFGATSLAVVFGVHGVGPRSRLTCTGGSLVPITIDIAPDDRAGVTLPTAVEPVGGDQFVPGGAGQGDQVVDRSHGDSFATDGANVTSNRDVDGSPSFAREAP